MTRRFLAVLLVVMAALAALAILLTLTTRGEEPLSDAAIPASWSEDRAGGDGLPRFETAGGKPADVQASGTAVPDQVGQASRPLIELATVRVEVDETAQRASPVAVWLKREGDPQSEVRTEIRGEAHEWTVAPGRWELSLTGSGWSAGVDKFEVAAGAKQLVRVTARNRVSGLLVAARSGLPVERATITPRFLHGEPGKLEDYFEAASIDVEAPKGHFALAGFNLPYGGSDFRFAVFDATAEGRLETKSDPLPFKPGPFWSGVVIAFPDPILTGRVRGTDPDLGDVPVPGASIHLVAADVGLENFVFSGGAAFPLPDAPRILAEVRADVEGAFSFGPIPEAPTVLRVRALVSAQQWMEQLSDPLEIDQQATLPDVELRLRRGGRIYATLRVPLTARSGPGERQPVARAESMTMIWLDPPPGVTAPKRAPMARQLIPSGDPENALFEFDEGGLPAGHWRLAVTLEPTAPDADKRAGSQLILTEAEILDGQRTDVVLEYPSNKGGLAVTGTAHLPEDFVPNVFEAALGGSPEAGRMPTPVAYAPVSAAGQFELHDVPTGDWTLVIFATTEQRRDLAVVASFVHVGASSPPPIHLDLTHPVLLIHAGEKTRNRRLVLSGRCGDPVLDTAIAAGRVSVRPDAEGAARILGLLPARWTLTAEGEPPAQVDVELPPGAAVVRAELP